MKHKLLLLYSWLVRTVLIWLPDVPFIMRFRGWLFGLGMRSCGKNFQVAHDANIKGLEEMSVGANCYVANNSIILGSGMIVFEGEVQVGPNCVLTSGNHISINGSYYNRKRDVGSICLCKGSWVAANCTLAKGALLPSNSVLAANSFLGTKLSESNSVYGGVPAKYIKSNLL